MRSLQNHQKKAFSLVELLAVVAIIIILMALLLPVAGEVRHNAKLPGCLQNMRIISIAYTQFCSNNDGNTPGPNWAAVGSNPGRQHGWLYGDRTTISTLNDVKTGQLWPYIRDTRAFRCPADRQPDPVNEPTFPSYPYNTRLLTSYVANGSTSHYSYSSLDYTTLLLKTYRISLFAAEDVMYWEGDERTGGGGSWGDWWDGGNTPNQGMTRRHGPARNAVAGDPNNEKGVMGCNDGHAEIIVRQKFLTLGSSPRRNRVWNVPNTPNGR